MNFNNHSNLEGMHAFLGASKYHWINYDLDKLDQTYTNYLAVQRGTSLHEMAANLIKIPRKLPKSYSSIKLLATYACGLNVDLEEDVAWTLYSFVNDAIGFRMSSEQILRYSDNCFGTTDAISFKDNFLRIHDLKTGEVPGHMEQLEIYEALFCLEYGFKPANIGAELRLYQNNEVICYNPPVDIIVPIMDKIVTFDKFIDNKIKSKEI